MGDFCTPGRGETGHSNVHRVEVTGPKVYRPRTLTDRRPRHPSLFFVNDPVLLLIAKDLCLS